MAALLFVKVVVARILWVIIQFSQDRPFVFDQQKTQTFTPNSVVISHHERSYYRICPYSYGNTSTWLSRRVGEDECVDSPEFMLLGNEWRLQIVQPGGDEEAGEGMVSLFLYNVSNKAIDIDFGFSVSDGNGKQVAHYRSFRPRNFAPLEDADEDDHGDV